MALKLTNTSLEQWFNQTLGQTHNVRLVGGGSEPEYLAHSDNSDFAQIIYRHDYLSSALHELAHWSIAGARRRTLNDYGYWYEADGRGADQQALFEKVEVKPQAIEWILSRACGLDFNVSADNLLQQYGPSELFSVAIVSQAKNYCASDLPERAVTMVSGLCDYFSISSINMVLNQKRYSLEYLKDHNNG